MNTDELFLRIRAVAHALDKLIEVDTISGSEDINTLSLMLVTLIDEYDEKRACILKACNGQAVL